MQCTCCGREIASEEIEYNYWDHKNEYPVCKECKSMLANSIHRNKKKNEKQKPFRKISSQRKKVF